jgi:hypothetical protein
VPRHGRTSSTVIRRGFRERSSTSSIIDAVVLGCTEIPLIMNDTNSPLPTLDSTRLLAHAALWRAVALPGGIGLMPGPPIRWTGAFSCGFNRLCA